MDNKRREYLHNVRLRYRGRGAQVRIYLGKFLRMFVYQNDWKVLPMAALIAGLVGMVIRKRLFISMEGTLVGAFAMVCVAIWNGCFNSIQVICRERDIVKREHRSGMHVSSYVFSHMVYQALLCLMQTGVTIYVTRLTGVQYPAQGLFTEWMMVDIGISMFLISYASDMMALWVSSLARSTTTAMTIMPFILIFQLVFSGGMMNLPEWSKVVTRFTISNYGLKLMASQANYNSRPMEQAWRILENMQGQNIETTVTLGQVLDLLTDEKNPAVEEIRNTEIGRKFTVGEARDMLRQSDSFQSLLKRRTTRKLSVRGLLQSFLEREDLKEQRNIQIGDMTAGEIAQMILYIPNSEPLLSMNIPEGTSLEEILSKLKVDSLAEEHKDRVIDARFRIGDLADMLAENPDVIRNRDRMVSIKTTFGKVLNLIGKERAKHFIETKAAAAGYNPLYEYSEENILEYWGVMVLFAWVFATLTMLTLENIDKDKR